MNSGCQLVMKKEACGPDVGQEFCNIIAIGIDSGSAHGLAKLQALADHAVAIRSSASHRELFAPLPGDEESCNSLGASRLTGML